MPVTCEIERLEPALQLLLASDGTLTDMLQALCREKINARKLAQEVAPAVRRIDSLDVESGELLMSRRVLLQGDRTVRSYVYAESLIALTRLDARFQQGLLTSDAPIGRLWRDNRVEIFKEITGLADQAAGLLARYFGTSAATRLLVRTCRVFVAGRPVMLISEHFSPTLADSMAL
jgi:chorismate-pyruvate lyase